MCFTKYTSNLTISTHLPSKIFPTKLKIHHDVIFIARWLKGTYPNTTYLCFLFESVKLRSWFTINYTKQSAIEQDVCPPWFIPDN